MQCSSKREANKKEQKTVKTSSASTQYNRTAPKQTPGWHLSRKSTINPFLRSCCPGEGLSPEWGWAHLILMDFNHEPPGHILLHPSAPGCCWELSNHLWLQKQHPQLIMCKHPQLFISAATWLHITSISAIQSKRVLYLLPQLKTKKQSKLVWRRRQVRGREEGVQCHTHTNKRGSCLPEATFQVCILWGPILSNTPWDFGYSFSLFSFGFLSHCPRFCSSQFPFCWLWEQTNTTSQIFNCSNLVQLPGCPCSKADLIQPSVFKGHFNSSYRPDEWDFNFQLSQFSSVQKCQILPSPTIQLSALHFVQMLIQNRKEIRKHDAWDQDTLLEPSLHSTSPKRNLCHRGGFQMYILKSIFKTNISTVLSIPSHIHWWDLSPGPKMNIFPALQRTSHG